MAPTKNDPRLYMTAGGKQVELTLIPPLQAQMVRDAAEREAIKQFGEAKKPTYKTEMDEVLEHDETSITDERTPDEDKAAWLKWQETQASIDNHIAQQMMRFFLYYGVAVDPDTDTTWQGRQKFFGIEIPEDPIERKIHYIQTEMIFSPDDIQGITTRLMTLAGVRQEVVDAAVNSFRS